jgi:hypothetical protein
MLPEVITSLNSVNSVFGWKDNRGSGFVEETEWLHVCWLVEQTLNTNQALWDSQFETYKKSINPCATWQQRAIALAKVKGITI